MREILFRGKSAKDGKWFTGQLLHFKSPVSEKELNIIVEGCEWDDSNEWFNIGRRTKVVSETVGQYTGLTDKNGKKIFEGDIIDTPDRLVKVVWFEGNAQFDLHFIRYTNEVAITNFKGIHMRDLKEYEVIGNIYDNPELFEG